MGVNGFRQAAISSISAPIISFCLIFLSCTSGSVDDLQLLKDSGAITGSEKKTYKLQVTQPGNLTIVVDSLGLAMALSVKDTASETATAFEPDTGRNGQVRAVISTQGPASLSIEVSALKVTGASGKFQISAHSSSRQLAADQMYSLASEPKSPPEERAKLFVDAANAYAKTDRWSEAGYSWLAAARLVYFNTSDYKRAMELAKNARAAFEHGGKELQKAESIVIGSAAEIDVPDPNAEHRASILNNLDTAEKIFAKYNLFASIGEVETYRGLLWYQTGDGPQAEAEWQKALASCTSGNDSKCMALALQNLGARERDIGEFAKASGKFKAALELINERDDVELSGYINDNVGYALQKMSDFDGAIGYHLAALHAHSSQGRCEYFAGSLYAIGHSLFGIGDYQQSVRFLKKVIEDNCSSTRAMRSMSAESSSAGNDADEVQTIGKLCELAAAMPLTNLDRRRFLYWSTWDLGRIARLNEDPHVALKCHKIASSLADTVKYQTMTQLDIIEDTAATGNYDDAEDLLKEILSHTQRDADDKAHDHNRARAHLLRGQLYATQGKYQDARSDYKRALEVYAKRLEMDGQFESVRGLAALPDDKQSNGVEYFQQADALLEDIRTRSVDTNFRASVFSIRRDMYAAWISKIIDSTRSGARGSPAEDNKFLALALSERSRGRALKDMLEIYQRANTKNTRLPDFLISSSVDEVLTGTELLSPNANNKKTSLQSTPNRAEPTPSLSDTVASLRSFQSSLSESTTVVQYLLGKETSYAWVLRRNSLDLVILPSAARIKAAIDNATSELLKTGSSSDQRKVLGRVYDLIFEPLEQHLANGDLIISPDDSLYALPFAALWDAHRGKYLVERFAISYVPSLHASIGKINVNATPTTQERALIVGDAIYNRSDFAVRCLGQTQSAQRAAQPSVKASLEFERLISSGTETRQVTALIQQHGIDAVSLSECSATRERVLQELRQPLSYVHLATHASVNLTVPQYSAIYLTSFSGSGESIGGLLTVQDLVREKLATKLVVLTGCSTGGGRRFAGESPIGLTFAILAAGSKQVLSTSWPAADAPTAEAMTTFYQRLLNERDSAAQALRQAQLSLLRSARWKSPRYWAPFTIFGLPVESDRAQTGFTRST